MLNIETIENTLLAWVETVEPTLVVIFDKPNAPRPALP